MIPFVDLSAQYLSIKAEINEAIQRVLDNTSFIMGPEVASFEKEWAAFCDIPYAVGVASGTAALQLGLLALGVGEGDEVITTTHTFIATAEAIRHVGARPVFVDIDPKTYNIDPALVEAAVTKQTKAIMPVHLYGQPAEMDRIKAVAAAHDLFIVEDAAQAHGARYKNRPVGEFGQVAAFSFYPGKNLGAYGDAGAVVTTSQSLAQKISMLSNHGRQEKYRHEIHGFGERLDALQAAILNVKLKYLRQWIEQRQVVAQHYLEELAGLPLHLPYCPDDIEPVYHLFVIQLESQQIRDQLQQYLRENDVSSGVHYPIPLHLQPALSYLNYEKGAFPQAEKAAETILSLPIYPELTETQQDQVITTIRRFFTNQ